MELHSKEKPQADINWLELMKTLSSKPRLETLFYLFIYQNLSLTDLSHHLKKSKNTTVYHMKRLVQQNLIMEFDKPIPGSIKPEKCYHLNPDFYQQMFLPFDKMAELSKTELVEYTQQVTKWNALLFETMREILKELSNFYQIQGRSAVNSEDALKIHQDLQTPRDLIPLSEKGLNTYLTHYQELLKKTQAYLTQENAQKDNIIRPYLVFNAILPIKEILEFKRDHGN